MLVAAVMLPVMVRKNTGRLATKNPASAGSLVLLRLDMVRAKLLSRPHTWNDLANRNPTMITHIKGSMKGARACFHVSRRATPKSMTGIKAASPRGVVSNIHHRPGQRTTPSPYWGADAEERL